LVLWVNEAARQQGVLPGLRYAAAFSLASTLRAGEVSPAESEKAVADLTRHLLRFTPEVEPSKQEPGVFWLNGSGLQHLYASPKQWAHAIQQNLHAQGFSSNLTVGFTRFGSYAIAKARGGITILRDPAEEQNATHMVPLHRLNIEPKFRDMLFKLGVKTVGALLALPPGGLRERFGKEAHRLHRMAAGDLWTPLDPCAPEEPARQKVLLDDAEDDTTRLLFLIKQLLHPLVTTLAARHQALAGLWLSLLIDHGDWLKESLRPAAPTLDAAQILDLVRLRLESLQLAAGVVEIEISAETCAATSEQLRLFERSILSGVEGPTRDLDAANRALARLRAEFGEESVVCAKLTDGHLPEARFTWEPLDRIKPPRNENDWNDWNHWNGWNSSKVLVRRVNAKPIRLAGGPYHSHEDGWLILGPKHGNIDKLTGPYIFTGGWWNKEIQREYYYAETRRGDLLWLYYDRVRRRWFLQGVVE
jgi:protein ImuB